MMSRNVSRPATDGTETTQPPWEVLVTEAVGSGIEFWGFKHNHGRVWALLYLRGEPMAAGEIQQELGLSKGAVSMITRELEEREVIHRVRTVGSEPWRFEADTDLMAMMRRVLATRESGLLGRIEEDLVEAERSARQAGDVDAATLDRLARLRRLATMMHGALELFLTTSRLDLGGAAKLLGYRRPKSRREPHS